MLQPHESKLLLHTIYINIGLSYIKIYNNIKSRKPQIGFRKILIMFLDKKIYEIQRNVHVKMA